MSKVAPENQKFKVPTTKLSTHFSVKEFTRSEYAERNNLNNSIPDLNTLENLQLVAAKLEAVRTVLGNKPIRISSGYRSPEVNKGIGSTNPESQHTKGQAADFDCDEFGTPVQICKAIIAANISFDQLILEHSWVHISTKNPSSKNRKQVLSLLKSGKYATGLTNKFGKEYK